jgi:hypothetical protein
MMMRTGVVLGMLVGLLVARPLRAQEPSARAWSDSTSFVIGDPITVHVEITHRGALRFTPLVGDTAGVFHILSRTPVRSSSATTASADFIVAAYDSGTAILPPLQFAYTVPPDSAQHIVATNPLVFTIRLVDVDTTKDIKDIKPPLSIPWTVAEISLIIGTLVGAALLVYSFLQYRKRKKRRQPEERYVPPPKPAHVIAFEQLALLKEKRLWQQGLIKPFYTEVSEIVRRYFENRFGFLSLEKTTDETLHDLQRFSVAHSVLPQTETLLRRADLVKFAKYQPTIAENEEMLALAFDIVERTKVVERPQPAAESVAPESSEVVHV